MYVYFNEEEQQKLDELRATVKEMDEKLQRFPKDRFPESYRLFSAARRGALQAIGAMLFDKTSPTGLVRVRLASSYVVPDTEEKREQAIDAVYEGVQNAVKYDELENWIEVEPAYGCTEADVPSWILEGDEEE